MMEELNINVGTLYVHQTCNFVIAKKKIKWLGTKNFVQCFNQFASDDV